MGFLGTSVQPIPPPPFSILMRGSGKDGECSAGGCLASKHGDDVHRGGCWIAGRGACSRERWLVQVDAGEGPGSERSEELLSDGRGDGRDGRMALRDW